MRQRVKYGVVHDSASCLMEYILPEGVGVRYYKVFAYVVCGEGA